MLNLIISRENTHKEFNSSELYLPKVISQGDMTVKVYRETGMPPVFGKEQSYKEAIFCCGFLYTQLKSLLFIIGGFFI